MRDLMMQARYHAFAAKTMFRKSADVSGISLSVEGVSPKMRYVMFHGYESGDADLASQVLDANDTVLEAGSATGYLAIHCTKRIGVRGYTMVEANAEMEPRIRKNFQLNGLEMPKLVVAAVAPVDGTVSFGVNRDFWSSSTLQRDGQTHMATVAARSIPSLVAEIGYQPSALIIDIEGGEVAIPIEHFAPFRKIVIELHHKLVGVAAIDKLMADLHGLGFRTVEKSGRSRALVR